MEQPVAAADSPSYTALIKALLLCKQKDQQSDSTLYRQVIGMYIREWAIDGA